VQLKRAGALRALLFLFFACVFYFYHAGQKPVALALLLWQ
jgi:hypothetical protein